MAMKKLASASAPKLAKLEQENKELHSKLAQHESAVDEKIKGIEEVALAADAAAREAEG